MSVKWLKGRNIGIVLEKETDWSYITRNKKKQTNKKKPAHRKPTVTFLSDCWNSFGSTFFYFTDLFVSTAVVIKISVRVDLATLLVTVVTASVVQYCSKHSCDSFFVRNTRRSNWCICLQCNQTNWPIRKSGNRIASEVKFCACSHNSRNMKVDHVAEELEVCDLLPSHAAQRWLLLLDIKNDTLPKKRKQNHGDTYISSGRFTIKAAASGTLLMWNSVTMTCWVCFSSNLI